MDKFSSGDLNKLKVPDLRALLRDMGAGVSGTKKELVERIIVWKENNLSRRLVEPVEVQGVPVPLTFKNNLEPFESCDVSSFKNFSLGDISQWFSCRSACSSMEKGRKLFLAKFVKCVSGLPDGNFLHVSCFCAAETKKSIDYTVQVIMEQCGTIRQANCSCVAGTGFSAACKHVAALLYCLEHFMGSGTLHQLLSKTSMLQTWHHPPAGRRTEPKTALQLSAQNIQMPMGVQMKFSPSLDDALNLAMNHKSGSLLLNVCRPPADLYFDHDYCKENLVKKALSGVNHLTREEREALELNTRRQSKSSTWWKARRTRITASVVYRVVSTVRSGNFSSGPARNCFRPTPFSTAATKWGNAKEKLALKQYEITTGVKVKPSGLHVHPEIEYLASSPDGMSEDKQLVVEVKCPYTIRNEQPTKAGFLYQKHKTWHLKRNHPYYYQLQTHMYCTGVERCDLVVWTCKGMFIENIKFNKQFISYMLSAVQKYYETIFCREAQKLLHLV